MNVSAGEKNLESNSDPHAQVKRLSVAQQQIVEIVKMFSQDPQIVILDEPTSSLSDHEIDNLFEIILRMQKKGITFIYISHRMEEIKRIGNSGTVLRDGKFVASIDDVKSMDMEQIIKLIVGRSLEEQYPARESHIGDVLLDVQGLSVKGLIEDVSFQVRRGAVLWIFRFGRCRTHYNSQSRIWCTQKIRRTYFY